MPFSHGPGMLIWSRGEGRTQVGSSWRSRVCGVLSVFSSAFEGGGLGRLEAVYCLFCNVNSEERERAGSKNWTVNSPLSAACTACRHAKHWVDFAWDKPGPRFDPSPDIFGSG